MMRILVMTKRQYTAKDLLDDRYGRMFEIPAAMARSGHDVRGLVLSYRGRVEGWHRSGAAPDVPWRSVNALPTGLIRYAANFTEMVKGWRPDILWASSDVLHAILATKLSRQYGIPAVIDLYDNYESFGMTRLPGVRRRFRRACREAAGLTMVSKALQRHVAATCRPIGRQRVIGNGVRKDIFHRQDRLASRHTLGLPAEARLVGTAGALTRERGIGDLFDAFLELQAGDPDLWLVCAGPRDAVPARYPHPRVIDLGILPWQRVPALLNSLDVAVVCNRDSDFGRYCFPLKLYESIACGVPVVAAAAGDVIDVLADNPAALYEPGDVSGLAEAIRIQLRHPSLVDAAIPSWDDLGTQLSAFLEDVVVTGQ